MGCLGWARKCLPCCLGKKATRVEAPKGRARVNQIPYWKLHGLEAKQQMIAHEEEDFQEVVDRAEVSEEELEAISSARLYLANHANLSLQDYVGARSLKK